MVIISLIYHRKLLEVPSRLARCCAGAPVPARSVTTGAAWVPRGRRAGGAQETHAFRGLGDGSIRDVLGNKCISMGLLKEIKNKNLIKKQIRRRLFPRQRRNKQIPVLPWCRAAEVEQHRYIWVLKCNSVLLWNCDWSCCAQRVFRKKSGGLGGNNV